MLSLLMLKISFLSMEKKQIQTTRIWMQFKSKEEHKIQYMKSWQFSNEFLIVR